MRALIIAPPEHIDRGIARSIAGKNNIIVKFAASVAEASPLLADHNFDVATIDLTYTQESCELSLAHLQQACHSVPILAVGSAGESASAIAAALESGADDYVRKPCDPDELFARLIVLIRRSKGLVISSLEIGELNLDIGTGQVTKMGHPVELTPSEYRLLEYLSLRRGQVVTLHQLSVAVFEG